MEGDEETVSSLVDQRVVEMGFNNRNFESNVRTSMSTLDRLKSSLNFSGVASSMNANLNSLDTSVLTKSLSKASEGFSLMEIVAITAISNITNRIIEMGVQLVKSMSIGNIAAGWSKFDSKTQSVATLMAQGYDIDTVNEQLEKLGWFTDETSYKFVDMVSNISKFTAAGQELDHSVDAMMGIANWAALSGQNADVASRAMYQLAQAMSMGRVTLQHWRSIQNANMDTQEFRQNALDAAVALGTLQKTIDGKYLTERGNVFDINQFTQNLTEDGWLSADVLLATLGKYSAAVDDLYRIVNENDDISTTAQAMTRFENDLDEFGLKAFRAAQEARSLRDALDSVREAASSSWMDIFENIFGSYDESRIFWTDLADELYDVFIEPLNFRNEVLSAWADLGGRNTLFANTEEMTGAFWNLFYAITDVRNLIRDAWGTIFPMSTMEDHADQVDDIANKIFNFTERLREMSESLLMSEEVSERLTMIFQGMFSIVKVLTKAIGALWTGIQPLFKVARDIVGVLLYALSVVGERLTDIVATTDKFEIAGKTLANFFENLIDWVYDLRVLDNLRKTLSALFDVFKQNGGNTENYTRILAGLRAAFEILLRSFTALVEISEKYLLPILKDLGKFLLPLIASFAGLFIEFLAWIADGIVRFNEFTKTNDSFKNGLEGSVGFLQSIPSRLSFLIPFLQTIGNVLTGVWQILRRIPSAISNVITTITGSTAGEILSALARSFRNALNTIADVLKGFGRVDSSGVDDFNEDMDKKFSPLRVFLEGLGKLFMGLWAVLKAIVPVIGIMLGWIGDILGFLGDKINQIFTGGTGAFRLDTLLDVAFWGTLIATFWWLFGSIFELHKAFANLIGGFIDVIDSKAMLNYSEALKNLSVSILIIVGALILLSMIEPDKLAGSLAALGIIMGMLMGLMTVMKGMFTITSGLGIKSLIAAKSMTSAASAILLMMASVLVMVWALSILGKMDQAEMMNGIFGIVMLLGVLLTAAAIIGKNKEMFKKGAKGLVSMALAVLLLSIPIERLGKMDPQELMRGIGAISALIFMTTLFAAKSGSIKKGMKSAKGMIPMALALLILTTAVHRLGSMSNEELTRGLIGIGSILLAFTAVSFFSKFSKKALTVALSMVVISGALLLATLPMQIIGRMSDQTFYRGLTGIGAILAMFTAAAFLSRFSKKAITTSLALIVMSTALLQASLALRLLGSISWDYLARAGAALAGLVVLLVALDRSLGTTSIFNLTLLGFALSSLSIGLMLFALALRALGSISWGDLAKSTLIIVGLFAGLALAAKFLAPVVPIMVALAFTMLLFGAAALMLAVSLSIIVGTLAVFGSIMAITLIRVSDAIIQAGPKITQALTTIITSILGALDQSAKSFFSLLDTIVEQMITILYSRGPSLIDVVITLFASLLKSLADNFPSITSSITTMILVMLKALSETISEIVDIVIDITLKILDTLKERIPEIIKSLVEVTVAVVTALVDNLRTLIPVLVAAGFELIIGLILGLGEAIEENAVKIRETMLQFAKHLWAAFLLFFGINSPSTLFFEAAGYMIQGLLNGLKDGWKSIVSWFKDAASSISDFFSDKYTNLKETSVNMVKKMEEGFSSRWRTTTRDLGIMSSFVVRTFSSKTREMKDVGRNIINSLSDGISDAWDNVSNAAGNVANGLVNGFKNIFGIRSPSRVFAEMGEYIDMGLAKGMTDHSKLVYKSAEEVGDKAADGIQRSGIAGAIQKIHDLISNGIDDEIVIRPVMDLSEIQNGTNEIYGMMKDVDGLGIKTNNHTAENAFRSMKTQEQITNRSANTNDPLAESNVVNNTFNISGNNPKEIADEVSRVIQKQIDRRQAKWAR